MMSDKPSLLIIPGSFAPAQMYYTLLDEIAKLDPTIKAYVNHLPSATRNSPESPACLQDDAVFFRRLIDILADRGEDVVVMAHSYGGVVGTECLRGVTRAARQEQGKTCGVVRIVYLSAQVPPLGRSLLDQSGEISEETIEIGNDGYIRILDVELIARSAFPELPFERAFEIVKSMGRQSVLSFEGKVTYAGYRHVPVSWIFCENDAIISPTLQREYIQRIEEESGKRIDLHTLASGHSPNVTVPDKLAEILVKILAA